MFNKASLRASTDALIAAYLASGRKIVVVPASRKTVKTFRMSCSVANKGAKAVNLKNSGIYYR